MLEEIRKLIGARFDKRFQMSADWEGKVTPFVEKKLKKLELESRNCYNSMPTGKGGLMLERDPQISLLS